jgi:trigger factor
MIKVEVETLDAVHRRLAVEVPAEHVQQEIDRAYGELARRARVRGFRPGRTPRPVLEQLFGDQVRAEVFARLIQQSYEEALRDQSLPVVSEPQIVTERAEPGASLRYSATVEVKPELRVRNYTGLSVVRPTAEVTEAEVNEFLHQLQESSAQLRPVTDRSRVERGDVVTIDFEARRNQRLVGRAENRLVEIGRSAFSESFDQQLQGAEVGAACEFPVVYPADHKDPDVAGSTVQFRVNVKSLATKETPPLDDDFAKDHGECDTLVQLRERVRAQLESQAARRADDAMRAALVDQLVEAHDLVVPDAMVQRRAQALAEDILSSVRDPRLRPRDADEQVARLVRELEPEARKHVKAALLLESIAQEENLQVGEDDLEDYVSHLAARAGSAAERVRALYQDSERRAGLRGRLLQQRALDVVVARANITNAQAASSVADPR